MPGVPRVPVVSVMQGTGDCGSVWELDRLAVWTCCVTAAQAQPPQPLMSAVFPAGGQRGATLAATVMGTNLQGAVGVHVSGAGVTGTCRHGRQAGHDSGLHHGRSRRAAGRTRYPRADARRLFQSLPLHGGRIARSQRSRTEHGESPSPVSGVVARARQRPVAGAGYRLLPVLGDVPGRPSSVPCRAARFCPTFPMPCRVGWMPA